MSGELHIEIDTEVGTEQVSKTYEARPFQFSIKAILAVITMVALCFVPGAADVIGYYYRIVIPVVLAVAIWKGRGWIRPFAVFAIVPHMPVVCRRFWLAFEIDPFFVSLMIDGVLAGIVGAI